MYFLTPHDLHLPNARLAARHSKHILMEKPIARSIPEAMALIDAATEGGVRLMGAENYRFLPGVARCKELIREGAIGQIRILQLESTYHMYSTYDTVGPDPWRLNAERCGGGTFIDAGIHCVDLLINIGGFPETVYASKPISVLPEIEGEDSLVLMTRLPNGVIGTMIFSSARPVSEWKRQMLITGTTGEIRFDQMNSEIHVAAGETSRVESVPTDQQAYRRMFREFKDSVAENRESLMSGQEAINDLAVVLAAYESADTGTPVSVQMHPIGDARFNKEHHI